MTTWSVPLLLQNLHKGIHQRLEQARESFGHPGTKGDASEAAWLALLETYLPKRYSATKGHVCDSQDNFSQQIDIIVYDRQYSPLIFELNGEVVVPAESVYAVFEAKQVINATLLAYAQEKIASVRALHRTSLPIPTANGIAPARMPSPILGGFLALESEWNPPMGDALIANLRVTDELRRVQMGCVAAHGHFLCTTEATTIVPSDKAATAFLFELITQLQQLATVPMIDIGAYAAWLQKIE